MIRFFLELTVAAVIVGIVVVVGILVAVSMGLTALHALL